MLSLVPTPKIITFDCYGTLVRWHQAIRDAARSVLFSRLGTNIAQLHAPALADEIRRIAVVHQQCSPYRKYEEVLRLSLHEALAAAGHTATEEDHRALWSMLSQIPPHPDTPQALTRLRKRYRLGIISNTDDALIAGTVAAIGASIDFVITAEQAKAYKPDHRLFEYAHAEMKVTKDETIHVGMGQFTDLKVCNEYGIRSVWIDREGEPLDLHWRPDAILPDLSALPELLFAP